jgi:hypothetical protein
MAGPDELVRAMGRQDGRMTLQRRRTEYFGVRITAELKGRFFRLVR